MNQLHRKPILAHGVHYHRWRLKSQPKIRIASINSILPRQLEKPSKCSTLLRTGTAPCPPCWS